MSEKKEFDNTWDKQIYENGIGADAVEAVMATKNPIKLSELKEEVTKRTKMPTWKASRAIVWLVADGEITMGPGKDTPQLYIELVQPQTAEV